MCQKEFLVAFFAGTHAPAYLILKHMEVSHELAKLLKLTLGGERPQTDLNGPAPGFLVGTLWTNISTLAMGWPFPCFLDELCFLQSVPGPVLYTHTYKSKSCDCRLQVCRRLRHIHLSLLLSLSLPMCIYIYLCPYICIYPPINRPTSQIVADGTEANKITKLSNN